MTQKQHRLIQSIDIDPPGSATESMAGPYLPVEWLLSASYIETLDLTGPMLILVIQDHFRVAFDDLGATEGGLVTVMFDDVMNEGMSIEHTVLERSFRIATLEQNGHGLLQLNCIESHIWELMKPANKSRFFVNKPLSQAVEEMTGLTAKISDDVVVSRCHLNAGDSVCTTLDRLALEQGCAIWLNRDNELCMTRMATLASASPTIQFRHNDKDPSNQYPIKRYTLHQQGDLYQMRFCRNFGGWSQIDELGQILPETPPDLPYRYYPIDDPQVLTNLNWLMVPLLELDTRGVGELEPGEPASLIAYRFEPHTPTNDRFPDFGITTKVVHYVSGEQAYLCRVELGVPKDAVDTE